MNSSWISEFGSKDAKLLILVGSINNDLLLSELNSYPCGVLWIGPREVARSSVKTNLLKVDPKEDFDKLDQILYEFMAQDYLKMPVVKVAKVTGIDSELYTKVISKIGLKIESVSRARRTRASTGFQRQEQIFFNLSGYLLSRVPKEWSSLASNSVAVVVGAGPSLDVTLPILNETLIRSVLVIAADSTLNALKKLNIEPNFVVSIDPNKTFSSCCDSDFTPGIAILSSQSHPSWKEKWGNRVRYLSGRVLTEDWLAGNGVPKTSRLAKNNSGLTALSFADFLNPSLILLAGMDLSGGDGGSERYAESTGRSYIKIEAFHYHNVPGNYIEKVQTPFLSDWSETSMETSLISSRRTILNFTDRGARLEGCTLVHPDDSSQMNQAISENIRPFTPTNGTMEIKREISGLGMEQLLTLLGARCDLLWDKLNNDWGMYENTEFFKKILSDRDIATLFGDFAFVVMPYLEKDKLPQSLAKQAIVYLKKSIWTLEDSIISCRPSEEFLVGFLKGKLH